MRKHAKKCWGDVVVASADSVKNVTEVQATTIKGALDLQLITAAFKRKGKVKYSHRQHTKTEARAEIIRWVAESQRPFEVVADCGFQCLMKTGRPDYYIPSPTTVSQDVKRVFVNVRKWMAKILQVCALATSIYSRLITRLTSLRNMRPSSTLRQMCGHRPTTRCSLPSPCISRTMGSPCVCYWTWWKSQNRTPALLLQRCLQGSLKILGYQIRSVSIQLIQISVQ
jgi:hypothetical protein